MGIFSGGEPAPMSAAPPTTPQAPTMANYNANYGQRRRQANPTIMTSSQGELTAPRRTRTTLLGE